MKAEDREPLAQALFDAGYGVGEQVDIDRLKAKLAALGYEVRPIAERERYEALRRYRFATEGIEQAAAEAADREAAGGEPSGERIVDSDRAIPSAAVAPYEHPHVWEVQEVCEGCGDRRAIAPATSSAEVGGSLDVEALRTALDGLDVYAYDRDLHGEPLEINEATHRIAAAYDAIRKRGGA